MDYKKLHEDVCFKRSNGKIIWQPRIQCWISDKLFADGRLPGIYNGLTAPEIFRELGCSARIYDFNSCFFPVFSGGIEYSVSKEDGVTTEVMKTPVGSVSKQQKQTPSSWAQLVTKEWVETEEDLKVYTYIEEHTDWEYSQSEFDRVEKEWEGLGAPCIFMPRVSMQRLYIDLMGVENAVYAVYDYEETVLKYFDALRESQFKMIEKINASPVNIINFGDNVHSGTLSPQLFEKYVLKEYQQRCERLHKADKFTYAHFDGDNRGLMEYYQQTGMDGIEAITPKPQGDVELSEVKKYLGDMVLVDGIPAVYFDTIYSEQTLIDCVNEIIDLFAPNLVLGISDEISSTGDIERIRLVGRIVDEYNSKFENN